MQAKLASHEILSDYGRSYTVGMSHISSHQEIQEWFDNEPQVRGIKISCAYDGQVIDLK